MILGLFVGMLLLPSAAVSSQPTASPAHNSQPRFSVSEIGADVQVIDGVFEWAPASGARPAAETAVSLLTQAADGGVRGLHVAKQAGPALPSAINLPGDLPAPGVPAHYALGGSIGAEVSGSTVRVSHLRYSQDVDVWVRRIDAISPPSARRGATVSALVTGVGLAGTTAASFIGPGVEATINGPVTDTQVPLLIHVKERIVNTNGETVLNPLGERKFVLFSDNGQLTSPAAIALAIEKPQELMAFSASESVASNTIAPLDAGATTLAAPGEGQAAWFLTNATTTTRFVRPATSQNTPFLSIPVTLRGLKLTAPVVSGVATTAGFEWTIESPELSAKPIFQVRAVVSSGGQVQISGDLPTSAFTLAEGSITLVSDINARLVRTVVTPDPDPEHRLKEVTVVSRWRVFGSTSVEGTVPQLLIPVDGAALAEMGPTFRWSQSPFADKYQIQVVPLFDDGPAINVEVSNPALVVEPFYRVDAPVFGAGNYVMLPGSTYTWRARAGFPNGAWSTWSAARRFKTPAASAATITPKAPTDLDVVATNTPTLTWDDTNPAVFYYEIQLSSDPDFGAGAGGPIAAVQWQLVHGGVSAPPRSYTPGQPLAPGTYYWRVRPRLQATELGPSERGVLWSLSSRIAVR